MAADQQDDTGMGMIRRRPVKAAPQKIAQPGRGGTDVGVAVVAVYTPTLHDPIHITVVAGPPYMVHDFVVAIFKDGLAHAPRDVGQRLFPGDAHPLAFAAL